MAKIINGYKVFLNCGRNAFLDMPDAIQKIEAMKEAKMFVVSKALKLKRGVFDCDIPDKLVNFSGLFR